MNFYTDAQKKYNVTLLNCSTLLWDVRSHDKPPASSLIETAPWSSLRKFLPSPQLSENASYYK